MILAATLLKNINKNPKLVAAVKKICPMIEMLIKCNKLSDEITELHKLIDKTKSILPKTKSIDPSNAIRSPKLIHRENLLS